MAKPSLSTIEQDAQRSFADAALADEAMKQSLVDLNNALLVRDWEGVARHRDQAEDAFSAYMNHIIAGHRRLADG